MGAAAARSGPAVAFPSRRRSPSPARTDGASHGRSSDGCTRTRGFMVADYNGWTDLPEAEREALDMLELSTPVLLHPKAQNCVSGGCYRVTSGGRLYTGISGNRRSHVDHPGATLSSRDRSIAAQARHPRPEILPARTSSAVSLENPVKNPVKTPWFLSRSAISRSREPLARV
jgi:hypothetical protein